MVTDLEKRVLVVEDFTTMAHIICSLLTKIGFKRVDHVNDVSTALAKLRAGSYGLVLSDWNMEPISGLAFLEEVRADPALKNTPFIMMTTNARRENVIAARKAGVDNYIVKPFTAATLREKIDAVFSLTAGPWRTN